MGLASSEGRSLSALSFCRVRLRGQLEELDSEHCNLLKRADLDYLQHLGKGETQFIVAELASGLFDDGRNRFEVSKIAQIACHLIQ